jgi:hypothetical protein
MVRDSDESRHRRSTAFGPKARESLSEAPILESRHSDQISRDNTALAAAPMNPNFD